MAQVNKPVSAEMFDDLYLKMATKIAATEGTIFEGVDLSKDCDKHYMEFIQNKYYYDDFVEESSIYEKNKIIKMFIESEVLSSIYTDVYDTMIMESDSAELSFKQQLLTENTEEFLNVQYKGIDNHEQIKFDHLLEEATFKQMKDFIHNSPSGLLGNIGKWIGIPLIKFTSRAIFGGNLMVPVREARKKDLLMSDLLGSLGLSLINYKSGLQNKGHSRSDVSRENLITFDNIDLHSDVKKIFMELARGGNKKDGSLTSLSGLIEQCVFDSKLLQSDIIDKGQIGYFDGVYDPRKGNYFQDIVGEFFKEANSDSGISGQIVQYRKCLITKLIDLYKFLMIVSISESQDYKKIVKIMHKGFTDDYVNLLSFMPEGNEQEVETKAKIIQLIQLRLVFDNLSKDLLKGAFDIDKDAGKFFQEKLKQVDHEVEQELSNRSRKIDVLFETQAENNNREIKGAALTEREQKRTHFLGK